MFNMNELGFSIIEKAIQDYRLLKKFEVETRLVDNKDRISKCEIEDFFHSDWCDFLLGNMRITGEDILDYLNRE